MLRSFQVLILSCVAVFALGGCQEEVKEIPASKSDSTNTPTVSEKEKQDLLEGENKHQEDAIKKRAEQLKTKKTKKKQ